MCSSAEATGQDGLAFDQKKPLPQACMNKARLASGKGWNCGIVKSTKPLIQTGRVQKISPTAGPVSLATHVRPPEHGGAKPQLHGQRLRGHWLA